MDNFTYHNPVKVVFGAGAAGELGRLIPAGRRVLLLYGGGSIRRNGIYDQVATALDGHHREEFGGIRPNPEYEHLRRALPLIREQRLDFLLAVGGGSVIDAAKFIALAARYRGKDPWELLAGQAPARAALPLGAVLTIPAAGSEVNNSLVISRAETGEKLARTDPLVFPRFAVLDPAFTFTLPPQQLANGIIDAFVHVCEQYLVAGAKAPLQARQAEAVLLTLVEEKERITATPPDYQARATFTWCAAQALNGLLACGVPGDWSTHLIGHELTARLGLDHGRSLAAVLPSLLRHRQAVKSERLLQYGRRVWGITGGSRRETIARAIESTAAFFESLGAPVSPAAVGVTPDIAARIARTIAGRAGNIGEDNSLDEAGIRTILGG